MRSKIIIPAIIATIITAGGVFAVTKADFNSMHGSLAQKIAEQFNLNQDEVTAVFEEHREENREQRMNQKGERLNNRLNQVVADGKITEDQKNAIIAKKEEMRASHEKYENLSKEEVRIKREEHREEFKQWAEENGIDLGLLGKGPGMGHGKGFRK